MREDVVSLTINRVAVEFGFGRIFIACLAVALVGLVLSLFRRTGTFGLIVASVGAVLSWLVLMAVSVAEVKVRTDPYITVVQYFYGPRTREAAFWGMIGIPLFATFLGTLSWRATMRRRRARLPIHLKNGLKAFFQRDYDVALKEFNTAVAIDRNRAETYNRRGQVYHQLGNLDSALADFDRAINLEPEISSAYRNRGIVFAARDDLDLALNDFDFALKLDPTDCASLLQRGLCLARLGRNERAVEELRRVLQMSNHTDYADPAREQLRILGAVD